jgi:hypothetical protein
MSLLPGVERLFIVGAWHHLGLAYLREFFIVDPGECFAHRLLVAGLTIDDPELHLHSDGFDGALFPLHATIVLDREGRSAELPFFLCPIRDLLLPLSEIVHIEPIIGVFLLQDSLLWTCQHLSGPCTLLCIVHLGQDTGDMLQYLVAEVSL